MRTSNILVFGIDIICPAVFLILIGCGSVESAAPEPLATQSELLTAPGGGSDGAASAPEIPSLENWKAGAKLSRPPKAGCFTLAYPSQVWKEVQCIRPSLSELQKGGGNMGGGAKDFWTSVAEGVEIQSVLGSFPYVGGVQSEVDAQTGKTNSYDLQINSNTFYSAACGSYTNCYAWQQFEYSSVTWGGIFIEYWMYDYPPANTGGCPNSMVYVGVDTCHGMTSVNAVPLVPITSLQEVEFSASAYYPAPGWDFVELYDPSNQTYYTVGNLASTLSLYQNWRMAEFNVLGDWNKTEAEFNAPGVDVVIQQKVTPAQYPGGNWLSCLFPNSPLLPGMGTGEYNNLNAGTTCSASQGSSSAPYGLMSFYEND